MSDHFWFYELLNEIHGPVSTEQIQRMVAGGRLATTDRIRPQSSEEWITVTDLKTLVENVASGEDEWEEVTDLDDLNFTFEDSSAGASRPSAITETDASEDDDRHAELDIDSFQLSGDPEQARHSAFDSVTGRSSETSWMVESLGQVLGPMTMKELVGMAETGALSAGDKIREEKASTWVAAEAVESVATALNRGAAGLSQGASMTAATAKRLTSSSGAASSGKSSAGKSHLKPSSPSRSKSKSSVAPGKKRRRKKKRSKKDELLAEIFADVFSEDGKVRDVSERPDLANSKAPSTPPTPNAATISTSAPVSNPPAGVMDSGTAPTAPTPSQAGMGASAIGYGQAARPKFTPPPKKAKKRGGGGISIEPKVLGAAAGLVVILGLLSAGFTGMISLPGFGVDAAATFDSFEKEFAPFVGKKVSDGEWQAFKEKYASDVRAISKAAMKSAGSDPDAAETLKSALLLIKLLAYDQSATEARETAFEAFKKRKK